VTGFYGRTPLVEFLGKGHRFANLTGEKLSEYHVTKAFDAVAARAAPVRHRVQRRPGVGRPAAVLRPVPRRTRRRRRAGAEGLPRRMDRQLGVENIEYAAKREGGRLGALQAAVIPAGAWAAWDRARLAQTGGSPEQYKHPCLIGDLKFRDTMTVLREV
jgi:hypothetical protein